MTQNFGEGRWLAGRKDHKCEACGAQIPRGEPHFQFKGMYEGEWQNWRMHSECHEEWDENGCGEFTAGSFETPARVAAVLRKEVEGTR